MLLTLSMVVMQAQPSPSSPWQSGMIEDQCALVRTYTGDAGQFLIELTGPIVGEQQLRVVQPKAIDPGGRKETLTVGFQPGDQSFVASNFFKSPAGGRTEQLDPSAVVETTDGRYVRKVKGDIAAPFSQATTMDVGVGNRKPVRLDVTGASDAVAAFEACREKQASRIGLAPADLVRPAIAAEPINPPRWFPLTDYPRDAMARGEEGNIGTAFFVETDGRVKDCRIVSSTPPALNAVTCTLLKQRGRFKPARDAAGQPVRSLETLRVNWFMP